MTPLTQKAEQATYLHSWVTLLPGFSFLSLWAQNTMAWMPALAVAWDRHTLKLFKTKPGLD